MGIGIRMHHTISTTATVVGSRSSSLSRPLLWQLGRSLLLMVEAQAQAQVQAQVAATAVAAAGTGDRDQALLGAPLLTGRPAAVAARAA